MDVDCEHCGSTFVTKYALEKHQKTSVYCLKLQGKSLAVNHACEDCNKIFTTVSNLNKHRKICPVATDRESDLIKIELAVLRESNKQKDAEIRRLKKKLKAARTTIQMPKPDPYPQKYAAKFAKIKSDPSFFCTTSNVATELNKGMFSMEAGIASLVAFIIPFISKDGLQCYVRNDRTRDSFYRYENGMWIKDACCRFIREILNAMKPFVEAWWIEYSKEMGSSNINDARIATEEYHSRYIALHYGIMYPNGTERDALLKEIVEKTSHLTNI